MSIYFYEEIFFEEIFIKNLNFYLLLRGTKIFKV